MRSAVPCRPALRSATLPDSRRRSGRAIGLLAQWHWHDPDQQRWDFAEQCRALRRIQGLRRRGRGRGRGRDGDGDGDG